MRTVIQRENQMRTFIQSINMITTDFSFEDSEAKKEPKNTMHPVHFLALHSLGTAPILHGHSAFGYFSLKKLFTSRFAVGPASCISSGNHDDPGATGLDKYKLVQIFKVHLVRCPLEFTSSTL